MKRIVYYGILIFLFSFGIGFVYSSIWKANHPSDGNGTALISNEVKTNEGDFIETVQSDEKVSYNAEFILKKYYDECGHFTFQYAELPKELINLTRQEVEDFYDDWDVESFSKDSVVLSQEIDSFCDEHYVVKLGDDNIEIYKIGNGGSLELYKETGISKEYLANEDIKKLEEGITVYGTGKLNSTIEDFE